MSPYFRRPKSFQRYFEDGLPQPVELIRQTVKEYFSDPAEVSASFVGTELLRVNVVMQNGDKYIVTAHRLLVGGTDVWSFAIFDDSPPSDFLAGLLALPKTVEAWRPYLLERIPDADEPEHSSPGTVNIRFQVTVNLDTNLRVWVHFDEGSKKLRSGLIGLHRKNREAGCRLPVGSTECSTRQGVSLARKAGL
jgi:hypothetical protein